MARQLKMAKKSSHSSPCFHLRQLVCKPGLGEVPQRKVARKVEVGLRQRAAALCGVLWSRLRGRKLDQMTEGKHVLKFLMAIFIEFLT